MKLIKLSEEHYIIVHKSDIRDGDFVITPNGVVKAGVKNGEVGWVNKNGDFACFVTEGIKITHSTQPFKDFVPLTINDMGLGYIPLSEVQEAIHGYDVEKMAENYVNKNYPDYLTQKEKAAAIEDIVWGFNAHKELVKDKYILSKEDIKREAKIFFELYRTNCFDDEELEQEFERILNLRLKNLKPIEWEVEFDEQGKLKIL